MPGDQKAKAQDGGDDRIFFIIAYLLSIISGIVVLIMKGEQDQSLKLHSMQAIFLGILSIVISIVFGLIFLGIVATILNVIIWLYGLYAGFEAYSGNDIVIPVITEYARRYSGYGMKQDSKKQA